MGRTRRRRPHPTLPGGRLSIPHRTSAPRQDHPTGTGRAPHGVEDHLERHPEQARPSPPQARLHAVGTNPIDQLRRAEETSEPPPHLTKTSYVGVVVTTARSAWADEGTAAMNQCHSGACLA